MGFNPFTFILYTSFILQQKWIMSIIRNNENEAILPKKTLQGDSKYLNRSVILFGG